MSASANTPTPETDAAHTFQEQIITCKSLERRLTVAREALKNVCQTSSSTRLVKLAKEALALTAPKS